LARNWKFESSSLQRRVCEPPVPLRYYLCDSLKAGHFISGPGSRLCTESAKQVAVYDGKLMGLPYFSTVWVWNYYTELLEKTGVEQPGQRSLLASAVSLYRRKTASPPLPVVPPMARMHNERSFLPPRADGRMGVDFNLWLTPEPMAR
jgi:hypothetical protein